MARVQIAAGQKAIRSSVTFSKDRCRNPLMVDLNVANRELAAQYTIDYIWEQDTSSPSFNSFPAAVRAYLQTSKPFFAQRVVLYPYSPFGQVFPIVMIIQAYPTPGTIYMRSYNAGNQNWDAWYTLTPERTG